MRDKTLTKRLFLSAIIALPATGPLMAQAPEGIADLVGARAAGGETQLEARGYAFVRASTGDDRVWTYWWNGKSRTCVTVVTMNGRYDSITQSPSPDCGEQQTSQPKQDTVPAQAPQWFDLGLVCFGEGQRPTLATRYGYSWDYNTGRYQYGNRTELATQDFDASVMIQLWDGGGRIRLPSKLIPPIHSRGDHGWWELENVSRGSDIIRATYRLNGLNKPTLTIDRRSGRISVRGTGDYAFNGTCDTADNPQRKF